MGEALTLTMGTMGDAVADGELRVVRTCVLGPVEAHASGRENRDMRESRDHVRSTCRARGAGGRHTTHAHGRARARAFDPGARCTAAAAVSRRATCTSVLPCLCP